ncbi:MAG: A/G-specific adenine glycosylase [Pseudomonadota bacterium]
MDWFAQQLLTWHAQHGRKDLPWQHDITPYRVWVSEIMLQQTQVATVIDYYLNFMTRFPTVEALAGAALDEVLHHWTGLGYYARARNLHKAAQQIVNDHHGVFPDTQEGLEALPGIGRSTAGAIRSIAQSQQASILDGNVKRVLTRFHAVAGYPGRTDISRALWQLADEHTPPSATGTYTQAIMDLGATLCTRRKPDCCSCPVAAECSAHLTGEPEKYPERKPKKEKPTRHARFFLISCDRMTLLERKPLDGLWGGLWTPPERAPDYASSAMLTELGAADADLTQERHAPQFRHTFTHFHLQISPVYLSLSSIPSGLQDTDHLRWVDPNNLGGDNTPIGLSAPAVKLLASLEDVFPS